MLNCYEEIVQWTSDFRDGKKSAHVGRRYKEFAVKSNVSAGIF